MDVRIRDLKVTSEDAWLDRWIKKNGDKVAQSPQYLYLIGNPEPMISWMKYRKTPKEHLSKKIIEVLVSLIKEGQKEPIKIYKDYRICTGHKRATCLLYLGKETIEAQVVGDLYKL